MLRFIRDMFIVFLRFYFPLCHSERSRRISLTIMRSFDFAQDDKEKEAQDDKEKSVPNDRILIILVLQQNRSCSIERRQWL